MRVTEVHRHLCIAAQLLVHGHLSSQVVRHALTHGRGNAQQLVSEGLHFVCRAGGFELGQLDEYEQSAGALDQGIHRAGVGRALDEAAFPVARELPILNLKRAHVDTHHVRDLTSAVLSFAARHAFVVRVAQVGDELAYWLCVDAVVDGLV